MFFGGLRFHEKWSLHAEAQYRDHGLWEEAEQLLLRTGLNFHAAPNTLFSGGYGRITSYADDGRVLEAPVTKENRTWQQLILRHGASRFNFEHRYRVEQRWITTNDVTGYQDRVRYLFRASVPLNKKQMEKGAFFVTAYDEIFLRFTSAPFDRNRLYAAGGYQLARDANVQAGWLAQTVTGRTRQYLQFALIYNPDLRKKK